MDNLSLIDSARTKFKSYLAKGYKRLNGRVRNPEDGPRSLTGISRKPFGRAGNELITFTYTGELSEIFASHASEIFGVRSSNIMFSVHGNTLTTMDSSARRDEIFAGLEKIERAMGNNIDLALLDEINSIRDVAIDTPDFGQISPTLRLRFSSPSQCEAFYEAMHINYRDDLESMHIEAGRIGHSSELSVTADSPHEFYTFLSHAMSLYKNTRTPVSGEQETPFDTALRHVGHAIDKIEYIRQRGTPPVGVIHPNAPAPAVLAA